MADDSPRGGAAPAAPQGYQSLLRAALRGEALVLTVESPPLVGARPLEEVVADVVRLARWVGQDGRIATLTVSDRVRTDQDHDAVEVARRAMDATGVVPLVHWAGKGRTVQVLQQDLERAAASGLSAFLLLTGDALRQPPPKGPARYVDAVDAIRIARRAFPEFFLAAAVNPFKYREEALLGQYIKAAKKLRAGADVLMAQIGWDPRKWREVVEFFQARGLRVPVLASVWLLGPRAATRLLGGSPLPGVFVPPDLLACLRSELDAPALARRRAMHRAALQVVGARLMGLAGAHLCGVHTPRTLEELLDAVARLLESCRDVSAWEAAWAEVMRHPDGRPVVLAPQDAFYLGVESLQPAAASSGEIRRFHFLQAIDRWVFDPASPVSRIAGVALRGVNSQGPAARLLTRAEGAVKGRWLGCQLCGHCRLPHTFFVCPETCPKGLANGPCGGTDGNTCEFGDRECIHAGIYRLAKHTGHLETWEATWVPPVPEAVRGTCSWVHHYRGEGSRAEALPPSDAVFRPSGGRTVRGAAT
ncbi:MAG: methylenetetrahydrofolate reductase C-terminal domain-containing protein [Armatimonadota bacterium]|nr:methylenetetrahydrofolate reductase C-terminal domain-containing protein [Armatimonadota bacterium]